MTGLGLGSVAAAAAAVTAAKLGKHSFGNEMPCPCLRTYMCTHASVCTYKTHA